MQRGQHENARQNAIHRRRRSMAPGGDRTQRAAQRERTLKAEVDPQALIRHTDRDPAIGKTDQHNHRGSPPAGAFAVKLRHHR
jgi:hypothetical protein